MTQRFDAYVEVALSPVPFTSKNPAIVEVAVVEVARNELKTRSP